MHLGAVLLEGSVGGRAPGLEGGEVLAEVGGAVRVRLRVGLALQRELQAVILRGSISKHREPTARYVVCASGY